MPKKPAIFFDLDGTMYRWQFFHDWVKEMIRAGFISPSVIQSAENAQHQYLARRGSFETFVEVLIEAFNANGSLAGIRVTDAVDVAKHVTSVKGDFVHVFPLLLNTLCEPLGYERIIITGTPTVAATEFANHHNIRHCFGTEYPEENGMFVRGILKEWFKNKAEAVHRAAETLQLDLQASIAIGDSLSDASMLQLVGYPIAFNPSRELFNVARRESVSWPIVFERKDVVCAFTMRQQALCQAPFNHLLPPELADALSTIRNTEPDTAP